MSVHRIRHHFFWLYFRMPLSLEGMETQVRFTVGQNVSILYVFCTNLYIFCVQNKDKISLYIVFFCFTQPLAWIFMKICDLRMNVLLWLAISPNIKEGHAMGNDTARISTLKWKDFHQCLDTLFDGVVEYMDRGISMTCFDGENHKVKIFLSAYLADMVEHYAVCLNIEGSCNFCETKRSGLDDENSSNMIRTNEDARGPRKFDGKNI